MAINGTHVPFKCSSPYTSADQHKWQPLGKNPTGEYLQFYRSQQFLQVLHVGYYLCICFQGARAQRVEYLLLHAFHARKFIVPDKLPSQAKEIKITKRKLNNGIENEEIGGVDIDETNFNSEINDSGKNKKGPTYAGGLVLEPKKGLYDKYILLLDFNSLYPSIIQVKIHASSLLRSTCLLRLSICDFSLDGLLEYSLSLVLTDRKFYLMHDFYFSGVQHLFHYS